MAVVGDLEMVVATKGQLGKVLLDSGVSLFTAEPDLDALWERLRERDLLRSVRVEVELAIDMNFSG